MSKGFGTRSSKKRRNVKQLYLDNQFAEGKKYYLAKNYSKAELIFWNLKNSGYEDSNLFLPFDSTTQIEEKEISRSDYVCLA